MPKEFDRFFWLFLILGVALRCIAINQPLVDAHTIRQCQTAAATESLIEQPGFNLSSEVPWSGDLHERYILELPVYNYMVIAVYHVVGHLDVSGKLTSIILWASSFALLQLIWRRLLDRHQATWANLLFAFAPLSVFYGQAFMPEMLVQLLAFSFLLLLIRYRESATLGRWTSCAAIGLLGLLVKLPEISHLYLLAAFLIFQREGVRAIWRPRYLIAGALTIIALKGWSSYADSVNAGALAFGTSRETLRGFIGPWQIRFHLLPWAMIFLYLSAFVVPGIPALAAAYGFCTFVRNRPSRLLGSWLISLGCFYLLWMGNTAANQSYYNLPALAPIGALFGIGMERVLQWRFVINWRRTARIAAIILFIGPALPVYRYLFKQDRQLLAAAMWVRTNTEPKTVILFRPNHSSAMIDYPFNPVMAYYGKRPTFVLTRNTPEPYREAAMDRAEYAVVTLPRPAPGGLLGFVNRFRHFERQPESLNWLEARGFQIRQKSEAFAVYARTNG